MLDLLIHSALQQMRQFLFFLSLLHASKHFEQQSDFQPPGLNLTSPFSQLIDCIIWFDLERHIQIWVKQLHMRAHMKHTHTHTQTSRGVGAQRTSHPVAKRERRSVKITRRNSFCDALCIQSKYLVNTLQCPSMGSATCHNM